jgi:2'-5' RNA ligase
VRNAAGTLRLFFALQPEAGQSAALVERVAPLAARLEAQRVPAENIHATLCFIGTVALGDLARLESVAAALPARRATLCFDTLEFWEKPRVLCATTGETAAVAAVYELAENLGRCAQAAGFHPDIKPFRPHLTLARKIPAARAALREWPQSLTPPLLLRCDRFVLMESRKGELGSTYSVVDSWPLYADDTDSRSANIQ